MKQEYQELLQPYFAGVPFPEIEGEKPLISIITPYFNNLQYVKEFFDSVFAQTYTNWELLFVDDASPDNQVEAIINAYAEPRIKFRRLGKNSGAAVARTAAFAMSSGEYVVCFDPDDIMHPWFLQALLHKALSPEAPDIVMMNLFTFGAEEALRESRVYTEKDLTSRQWIPGVSLAKRKLWVATGGQSASPEIRFGSQDWEFWLHCFEKCGSLTVRHVALPLFLYRQHATAISSKSDLHEHAIRRRIFTDHEVIFNRHGTGNTFLAAGYAKSVVAHICSGLFAKTFIIFLEGVKNLPFRIFFPALLRQGVQSARTFASIHVKRPLLTAFGRTPKS